MWAVRLQARDEPHRVGICHRCPRLADQRHALAAALGGRRAAARLRLSLRTESRAREVALDYLGERRRIACVACRLQCTQEIAKLEKALSKKDARMGPVASSSASGSASAQGTGSRAMSGTEATTEMNSASQARRPPRRTCRIRGSQPPLMLRGPTKSRRRPARPKHRQHSSTQGN